MTYANFLTIAFGNQQAVFLVDAQYLTPAMADVHCKHCANKLSTDINKLF